MLLTLNLKEYKKTFTTSLKITYCTAIHEIKRSEKLVLLYYDFYFCSDFWSLRFALIYIS